MKVKPKTTASDKVNETQEVATPATKIEKVKPATAEEEGKAGIKAILARVAQEADNE